MHASDFQSIEAALGIRLPYDYKQLLQNYPEEIAAARDLHLSDDADWLIEQNRFVRQTPENFFGKQAWRAEHFVIGEDGNGNCFYLNLHKGPPSPVYFLDHEQPDLEDVEAAPDFAGWLPQVQAQLEEYARNAAELQANLAKTRPPRPWWKFW